MSDQIDAGNRRRIERAMAVVPLGQVDEAARRFAEAWFGPSCVRLEIQGHSSTEYDDEWTTEHGDVSIVGFNAAGERLEALGTDVDDEVMGYYAGLEKVHPELHARLRAAAGQIVGGEAGAVIEVEEPEEPEDPEEVREIKELEKISPENWGSEAVNEAYIDQYIGLQIPQLAYWGPPELDPYQPERELASRINAVLSAPA